jgi:hypothetical protein
MTMKLVHKLCFVLLCLTWLSSQQVSASTDGCFAPAAGVSLVSADDSVDSCLAQQCSDVCEDAGYYLDAEASDNGPDCNDTEYDGNVNAWFTTGSCECDCYPLE